MQSTTNILRGKVEKEPTTESEHHQDQTKTTALELGDKACTTTEDSP